MELDYQCSLSDYREAMFSHMRPPLGSGLGLLFGAFFLAISIASVIRSGWTGLAIFVMVTSLFSMIPFVFRAWQKSWVERDFRKHPSFAGKAHLSADSEGLKVLGELERRETKWAAFTKYHETENLFILYEGARLIRIFPKRAFGSQQLEDFRKVLACKIPTQ